MNWYRFTLELRRVESDGTRTIIRRGELRKDRFVQIFEAGVKALRRKTARKDRRRDPNVTVAAAANLAGTGLRELCRTYGKRTPQEKRRFSQAIRSRVWRSRQKSTRKEKAHVSTKRSYALTSETGSE